MRNQKKSIKYLAFGIAVVTISLFVCGYLFIIQTQKGLYKEKLNYLEEISLKSAQNVQSQITGYFSTITAIATFVGNHETFDVQHSLPILAIESEQNSFKRMGIVLPDGTAMTTDGKIFDFSDRDYFQVAKHGENALSGCLIDKVDGKEINVFAVPIYHKGQIVGVIFATKTLEDFSNAISIDNFDGAGYSYIISTDGSPIVKTDHPDSIGDYTNLFDAMGSHGLGNKPREILQSDIMQGVNGSFEYIRDGIRRQMCYTEIGISDWYLITVVPSHVISSQSDRLVRSLVTLTVFIILIIAVCCFVLVHIFHRKNQQLQKIAYVDAVTGYSNWAKFEMDVGKLLEDNPQQPFAMIILDINKFKVINDMFGHEKGNIVLKFMAGVIQRNIGELETFTRASSDNFNILMNYVSDEDVIRRLEIIENEIVGCIDQYKIELSVGIYPITDRSLEIHVLSDRATISKNIAKKQNDLYYHFFKEQNRIEIIKEKEIENEMGSALANQQFEVYLQPKYWLQTEKIVGAEALVRWNRGKSGMVFPSEFIPIFEKNGFIRKLDLYMFEKACALIAKWKKEAHFTPIIPISINISRVHLSDQNLPANLLQISGQYGVEPELLEIELTESAIFTDVDEMIKIMHDIKKMGFLLSIDDFGSGYSSLGSIKDMPADAVKIDKSFMDEAVKDERGEKIILSIIDMIKRLGLTTIAEGAETEQQITILKNAGCDIVQGYYYSKPVSVTEFEKLLKENQ